jgi:FHS family L-fucose permease-like MFS transporter
MPPLQAMIMDGSGFLGMSATRSSFILPFICFVAITLYGWRTHNIHHKEA